jgi:hypothetical protein
MGHPAIVGGSAPRQFSTLPAVTALFMRPLHRRLSIALAVLLGLALLTAVAYQVALQRLKSTVLTALGPRARLQALAADWRGVTLHGLRITSEAGHWPADDELRAASVRLVPDLSSLFSGHWRIRHVAVEQAYLSAQREPDGRLRVLPALLVSAPGGAPQATPLVLIDRISLLDAEVEFFDASVRRPPHRLQLVSLNAEVHDLRLPALDTPLTLDLQALLKGPQHDGRLKVTGQLTPASQDAELQADCQRVDLIALQPYLMKVSDTGVRHGLLDLSLSIRVRDKQLKAPGTLVLRDVELGHGGQLACLPQRAVVAAMSRQDRISLQFTLAGRLDDPHFSLNENLATKVTAALAENVGVSVGGLVTGMGNVIKGLFGR